jgi:hypothetical protein
LRKAARRAAPAPTLSAGYRAQFKALELSCGCLGKFGKKFYRVWTLEDRHVLVQPEMERGRSPLASIPPCGAGIFKASGSTDPMRIWKQRKEQVPALLFIVSMSPPGYPSARLRPRRARFRFARQDHCSATTSIGLNFRMRRHPTSIGGQHHSIFRLSELGLVALGKIAFSE